jgi:hypothetical protein
MSVEHTLDKLTYLVYKDAGKCDDYEVQDFKEELLKCSA